MIRYAGARRAAEGHDRVATHDKPYLTILGGPGAGMDAGAREKFLASLRKVGGQKRMPALIHVTYHNVDDILPRFGKALVLRDGGVLDTDQAGSQAAGARRIVWRIHFFFGSENRVPLASGKMTDDGDQQLATCSKVRGLLF